jgi:hypothetical protein
MTALAFVVQLLPFAVILAGKSSLWCDPPRQFLATLVLLFVLPNRETFLTTTNSQFVLSLAVLLVALEDKEPSRMGLVFRGALVLLAGLTGPPTCLLAPALAWRALRMRSRPAFLLFALLAACCVVQAAYLVHDALTSHQLLAQRRSPVTATLLGEIVLVKSLAVPAVGGHAAMMLHDWMAGLQRGHALLAIGAVVVWTGVLALAAAGIPPATRRPLLLGVITLTLVSSTLSMGAKEALLVPMLGERYYQAPNSALFIALAAGLGWRTWKGLLRGSLVALSLAVGLATYQQPFGWTEGPDWKTEIALWRADPTRMVRIWPEGWAMPLDPRAIR